MKSRGLNPIPVTFPNASVESKEETRSDLQEKGLPVDMSDEARDTIPAPVYQSTSRPVHETSESEEYEISSEYLEFIAVTRQHQKDRERKRMERKRRDKQTVYKDISTLARPQIQSSDKNKKTDGLIRRLQLSQWYGEEAGQRIGELQDQMDQQFNEDMRRHRPPFFPACPIVMTGFFDGNKTAD